MLDAAWLMLHRRMWPNPFVWYPCVGKGTHTYTVCSSQGCVIDSPDSEPSLCRCVRVHQRTRRRRCDHQLAHGGGGGHTTLVTSQVFVSLPLQADTINHKQNTSSHKQPHAATWNACTMDAQRTQDLREVSACVLVLIKEGDSNNTACEGPPCQCLSGVLSILLAGKLNKHLTRINSINHNKIGDLAEAGHLHVLKGPRDVQADHCAVLATLFPNVIHDVCDD